MRQTDGTSSWYERGWKYVREVARAQLLLLLSCLFLDSQRYRTMYLFLLSFPFFFVRLSSTYSLAFSFVP